VDAGAVDAENPWPGLAAFREVDQELFHGRERETEELLRRVLRERLTVLFGLSGLGKTSLLQAGLFPRLRDEKVLPISIRLDYSDSRRPLTDQIRDALTRAAREDRVEAPAPRDGETLWELFHRQGAEFWSARNRLLTPLLVFDQFEEIFTLGRQDAGRAHETVLLIDELAALCEGVPPRQVRARLDANPEEIRQLDFNHHPYKVLFSLREDFLPDLEALRRQIASLAHNRMRLLGMHGENALQVVTQGGRRADGLPLIDSATAVRVVRFVASQDEEDVPLADLDVEPALLSFVCRELNNKRRFQGASQITADLLRGTRETIFVDFYERSVGDLDPQVRTFIEDRLLTKSGYRDSVALETALETPGLTSGVLTVLTDRRLLRIEDRGGQPRIELTHDVLTGTIRTSRDTRRQREDQAKAEVARLDAERRQREAQGKLRRSRLVIAALGLVLLGVLGVAWWAWSAQKKAREALASAEVERALHLLQENRSASALAYFADAVRIDPGNLPARTWLTDLLLRRAWLLPTKDLQNVDGVQGVRFSQDGQRVLVFDQTTAWIWETATGRRAGPIPLQHPRDAGLSRDGRLLFTLDREGDSRLWETKTGQPLGPVLPFGEVFSFQLSPDGQRVAVIRNDGTVDLHETRTGSVIHHLGLEGRRIMAVSFGPQDSVLVAVSRPFSWPKEPEEIIFWDTARMTTFSPPRSIGYDNLQQMLLIGQHPGSMKLGSGGKIALGKTGDLIVQVDLSLGNLMTTSVKGPESDTRILMLPADNKVSAFEVSEDGKFVVELAADHRVRVKSAWSSRGIFEPLEGIAEAHISPDGSSLVTASLEGDVRLWSIRLGRSEPDRLALDPATHHAEISPRKDISPDGKTAVTGSKNGTVQIWDLSDHSRPPKTLPHRGPLATVRFSPDGRFVVTAGGREVFLWQFPSGRLERTLRHGQDTYYAELSRDGEHIVTTTMDGAVWIWGLRTGRLLAGPLRPAQGQVSQIVISPDGERFAILLPRAPEARLWSLQAGEPLGDAISQKGATFWGSARFTADGQRLVIAGTEEALIWDIPLVPPREAGDLADLAEAVAGSVVDENGKLVTLLNMVPPLSNLRRRTADAPPGTSAGPSLIRWFLSDPWERTISPLSQVTVPVFIRLHLNQGTDKARREAEDAFPGHPLLSPKPGGENKSPSPS
jgi:WD40 repeat protein